MPTTETLERFIARVAQNAHVEAIEEFYSADASMPENQSAPRLGRDNHVASERKVMARALSVTSECGRPVLVNGDPGVIGWIFHFEWRDGTFTHLEELAWQRWQGERIASEISLRPGAAGACEAACLTRCYIINSNLCILDEG